MIAIVPYRPAWAVEFQEIARVLREGLVDLALRIDHVGSTAVPQLSAKDVIDIQITVAQLDGSATHRLHELGFVQCRDIDRDHVPPGYAGPDDDWKKQLFAEPKGQRRINVHVRQTARPNQRYAILFRDYLIAHPPVAAAYGELKRRLAASLRRQDDYADVKDPAVDLIYFAAEEWAAHSRWQPR